MRKKRTVGLLTFHHVLNYGAVLQCWALMRTIMTLGFDCEVIPYVCPYLKSSENGLKFNKRLPIQLAKKISQGYGNIKKRRGFNAFINNELKMSSEISFNDFKKFYAIVVGSDQVWNLTLTGGDYTYFLEGNIGTKKISYAASFGEHEIPPTEINRLINDILNFDAVSLREKCNTLAVNGISAEQVVDPVLLVPKEEWVKLIYPKHSKVPYKYILVYCIEKSRTVFDFAARLAAEKNMKIIYLNQNLFFKEKGVIYKRGTTPKEFLRYLLYSEYVVTNSFHGTALSLILEKKVAVDTMLNGKSNKRIMNLIDMLDINKISIQSKDNNIDEKIDYKRIKSDLKIEVDKSIAFIKKALDF